jgi:hypothetical protein
MGTGIKQCSVRDLDKIQNGFLKPLSLPIKTKKAGFYVKPALNYS